MEYQPDIGDGTVRGAVRIMPAVTVASLNVSGRSSDRDCEKPQCWVCVRTETW